MKNHYKNIHDIIDISDDSDVTLDTLRKYQDSIDDADYDAKNWLELILTIYTNQAEDQIKRDTKSAKNALATLSYSELSAALYIFTEISDISTVVIGNVAKEGGFSRSVVGNAISKLTSSGMIEARSLGVKGTHIKVLNKKLIEEISKLS